MSKTRPVLAVSGLTIATTLATSTASAAIDTDFCDNVNFMVSVVNKQNATTITPRVEWSHDGVIWGAQRTGAAPSSGNSAIQPYSETEALSGAINIPVSYPTYGVKWCRLLVAMDNVTPAPTVTATVQRG